MPKQKTLNEVYEECDSNGQFMNQDVINKQKISSMIDIAKANLEAAEILKKGLDNKSPQWCVVYKLYYDSLRELADAFILFDKKKIMNHQCLFAYICTKHPELELDWNFFEKVRTKRNGINYYGTIVTFNDFKEIELQMNLYIRLFERIVKEKNS